MRSSAIFGLDQSATCIIFTLGEIFGASVRSSEWIGLQPAAELVEIYHHGEQFRRGHRGSSGQSSTSRTANR